MVLWKNTLGTQDRARWDAAQAAAAPVAAARADLDKARQNLAKAEKEYREILTGA
jgi:hypothetical protein